MAQARYSLPLLGLLLAASAQADTSPYYFGASAGLTHVSNLYRLPASQVPNSDDVATATLLAGMDKPFGRQRVYADASVRHNAYRRDKGLDNTGYALTAGLDWAALDKLSGSVVLRSNRSLATYNASTQVQVITEKNIEQSDQLQLSARYGLAGKLSLEGGLGHQRRQYSASAYRVLEYKQDSFFAGLGYRPSSDLRLGLTGRYTDGSGFSRLSLFVVPNDYKRKDIELTSLWTASGASTVNARLSYSKIENSGSSLRDYSGVTGRIGWQWQPSAKLQFSTSLARDTVQENYLATAGNSSDANRVGTTAQLTASYALTGKILADAGVNLYDLKRGGIFDADERSQGFNLGLRWLATRSTQLSCQLSHDKRDSDIATFNYSANSYGCTAQLTLR